MPRNLLLRHGATFDNRVSQPKEGSSLWALWMAGNHWAPVIAAALYGMVERYLGKLRDPELLSQPLGAALTEWIGRLTAVFTYIVAHVLDQAEDDYFYAPEHLKTLLGIDKCKFTWRRDDDCAGQWCCLRESELGITGAWRHVDDQVIELTPLLF